MRSSETLEQRFIGKRFGTRKCVGVQRSKGGSKLIMLCDCGKQSTVRSWRPEVFSCNSCRKIKHGHSRSGQIRSGAYVSWMSMIGRCTHVGHKSYKQYGAVGIAVNDRWMDFNAFIEDMGDRPDGMTLDRIDNAIGYCKENCRWSTNREQQRNKTNSIRLTYNGETRSLVEWADQLGVSFSAVYWRYKKGFSIERIMTPGKLGKSRKPR